jgi:hypothetical protein
MMKFRKDNIDLMVLAKPAKQQGYPRAKELVNA